MEECLVRIPRLPAAFEGFKIALFSDIHLYPFTPIQVVQDAVRLANFFRPDLVILQVTLCGAMSVRRLIWYQSCLS